MYISWQVLSAVSAVREVRMSYESVWTPRPGSASGRVWEIADAITRETGRMARRKDVIERYVSEGGNPNTASTQYHHWKNAMAGRQAGASGSVGRVRLTVAPDGRLVIPADMRQAMQIDATGMVTARVIDGELRVIAPRAALERARAMVEGFDTGEGSPVDELIRERRADAEKE
jgi:hypothetical protein